MSIPVTQSAIPGETRITCSEPGPRNDFGKPKLVAKIVPDAILVWCRYCRVVHRISREQCEAAWSKGESVVSACEGQIL